MMRCSIKVGWWGSTSGDTDHSANPNLFVSETVLAELMYGTAVVESPGTRDLGWRGPVVLGYAWTSAVLRLSEPLKNESEDDLLRDGENWYYCVLGCAGNLNGGSCGLGCVGNPHCGSFLDMKNGGG